MPGPVTWKHAALLAAMVTWIVVPLSLFVAYAPDGEEASGGFHQAQLTSDGVLLWAVITVVTFAVTYASAAAALARWPSNRRAALPDLPEERPSR